MTRRTERVSNLIRQEISGLIHEQVNDPRIRGLISVTKVNISNDLKNARVFVSALGTEVDKKEILQGLNAAGGFLRRELAARLTLRSVPELRFQFDDSIEQGFEVLQLIERVISNDGESADSSGHEN